MPAIPPIQILKEHIPPLTSFFTRPPSLQIRADDTNKNGYVVIPTTYGSQHTSPQPGVVAGIVLGCVGGFLLFLALLYSCLGWAPVAIPSSDSTDVSRSVLSFHTRKKRRTGPARATEMYEVRTHQHVDVDDRRPTSRATPIIIPAGPSRTTSNARPPPRVVRESDSEDEVVVIEDNTPPRRKSRRQSSTRYSDDRTYRTSDTRRDSRRYSRDR